MLGFTVSACDISSGRVEGPLNLFYILLLIKLYKIIKFNNIISDMALKPLAKQFIKMQSN
jgi:hypothetical protein